MFLNVKTFELNKLLEPEFAKGDTLSGILPSGPSKVLPPMRNIIMS